MKENNRPYYQTAYDHDQNETRLTVVIINIKHRYFELNCCAQTAGNDLKIFTILQCGRYCIIATTRETRH